ncbi:MAG: 4Fe-4S binding protein [Muribaculaceae bacterium]|nr:4Fe-4S binding protein [Muribaculaceae bacterium]
MKKSKKNPSFSSKNCTGCWMCVAACPQRAIHRIRFLWHRHAVMFYAACIGCNKCVSVCPNKCFTQQTDISVANETNRDYLMKKFDTKPESEKLKPT